MDLYFYEGYNPKNTGISDTNTLIYKGMNQYLSIRNINILEEWDFAIQKTEAGKPYFANAPFHFSVSHSGDLFVCAISEGNIGVDLQQKTPKDCEKIADRYFCTNEKAYVLLWGLEVFMKIWVKKEALVKFLGTTLGDVMSKYDLVGADEEIEEISIGDTIVCFDEIDMGPDIKCAIVRDERGEICIRGMI